MGLMEAREAELYLSLIKKIDMWYGHQVLFLLDKKGISHYPHLAMGSFL